MCPFAHQVLLGQDPAAPNSEQRGWALGRTGEGSSLEAFLIGHWEFVLWGSQRASQLQFTLFPADPGGRQFKRQPGTVHWQLCDRGESLKGQGCPRTATAVLLPEGKCQLSANLPSVQAQNVPSQELLDWVRKSCLCHSCQKDTAWKGDRPLDGAMVVDCCGLDLHFKGQNCQR